MITTYTLKRAITAAMLAVAAIAAPAGATTMVTFTQEDLAHLADVIVVADVKNVAMKAEAVPGSTGRTILTHNEVTVVETWKGDAKAGQLLDIVEPGGLVAGQGFDVPGTAGYQKNERVVLFLQKRRLNNGYLTIGMFQGKFTLLANGANGWGVTRYQVPMAERGLAFDARKARPVAYVKGDDFATFSSSVRAVVEADKKAGIHGKDLPQYKGIGR